MTYNDNPYDYTDAEMDEMLIEANHFEIDLYMTGKRMQAIKAYASRAKIEDLKVVAWYFFCLSKQAYLFRDRVQNMGASMFQLKDNGELKPLDDDKFFPDEYEYDYEEKLKKLREAIQAREEKYLDDSKLKKKIVKKDPPPSDED